ncbi:MAG TPA: DUF5667 domain-containing protein [Candidatus Limnocylindria bacterium]|nr:DUF5667 domain-containing protein [Candidatus Limnocylindria bacterium]
MPEPRMRDQFRRELRARLMNEAVVVLAPKQRRVMTWLRPALAVGLAALVLAIGAGSAAAGSVPGDLTFGLKRAIEEVRVALTFDDVERVRVLADITDKRLDELKKVADRNDKAPTASEEYAQAVTRFRTAVDALQQAAPEDKREKAQDVADAAREKHEVVLEDLKDRLPEKAKEPVQRAIDEERKDTQDQKDKKDKDNRGKENRETAAPRAGERTASPRATPRATETRRP